METSYFKCPFTITYYFSRQLGRYTDPFDYGYNAESYKYAGFF